MDQPAPRLTYPIETPPGAGEAVEVADGVLWLRLPLPMKLDHVNVFALDDGDGWTVVDTGFDTKTSRGDLGDAASGSAWRKARAPCGRHALPSRPRGPWPDGSRRAGRNW